VAADAATTPGAADRVWEKACRCTADAVAEAPVAVQDVAQAAAGPRAAMSERPS
jgi:hypothetical protein